MRNDRIPRKGPKLDQNNARRILQDIAAHAQSPFESDQLDLDKVVVALSRIMILNMSLVLKTGTQYHFVIVVHQFLARNLLVPEYIDSLDEDVVSFILTIPMTTIWTWMPNMYGLKRLCQRSSH